LSKKKKKKNISVEDLHEMFDVKKNLKKLKKHSGFEMKTESNIEYNEYDNIFEETSTNETQTYIPKTNSASINNLELELGLEKLRSEFKDSNTSIEKGFTDKVSQIEKSKLDKSDFKWWIGGVITAALLISGLIYSLSYSRVLEDIDGLEERQEEIKLDIKNLENRELPKQTENKKE